MNLDTFTDAIRSYLSSEGFDCELTPKGEGLNISISASGGDVSRADMEVNSSVIEKGARDFIGNALKGVVAQLKKGMR